MIRSSARETAGGNVTVTRSRRMSISDDPAVHALLRPLATERKNRIAVGDCRVRRGARCMNSSCSSEPIPSRMC